MHHGLPLGHLLYLCLDFRLHPGVGFLPSICQRLRQLPLILLFLGIFVRPSLGLGFLRGFCRSIRLCLRLGSLSFRLRLGNGFRLHPGFGFLRGIGHRLSHLPLVLALLGVHFRLSLGLRFLPSL